MNENVLVLPGKHIDSVISSEGFSNIELNYLIELIEREGMYIPRELAEIDENYRQIIPYVVLKDSDNYYLFKRTKKQGEKRLHEKYTLGVGGHINRQDLHKDGIWKTFKEGMYREVKEEVEIKLKNINYLGLINDLSTAVSRVHLGVAYLAYIEFFGLNEPDKFEVKKLPLSDLKKFEEKMEGWSRLVLMELLKR
ncbi:MAG: DNA mismatch repair protein MutT [Kosmotogaceae bacterium]